jgi:hypothetical protein
MNKNNTLISPTHSSSIKSGALQNFGFHTLLQFSSTCIAEHLTSQPHVDTYVGQCTSGKLLWAPMCVCVCVCVCVCIYIYIYENYIIIIWGHSSLSTGHHSSSSICELDFQPPAGKVGLMFIEIEWLGFRNALSCHKKVFIGWHSTFGIFMLRYYTSTCVYKSGHV